MKKYLVVLFLLFTCLKLNAQVTEKSHILGPSLGISFLGSTLQLGIENEYFFSVNKLGIEGKGLFGIGGILRVWNYNERFKDVKWDYSNFLIGGQGNYHFSLSDERLDPWCGLTLAYVFRSSEYKVLTNGYIVDDEVNDKIWLALNAGLRYWFENNMALGVRLGFGTFSYGSLDVNFMYKLN